MPSFQTVNIPYCEVKAYDMDKDVNTDITYQIMSGKPGSIFSQSFLIDINMLCIIEFGVGKTPTNGQTIIQILIKTIFFFDSESVAIF